MGPLVDGERRAVGHEVAELGHEGGDALVEVQVHGGVEVVGGEVDVVVGVGEQVRPLVVGQHDGHGLFEVGPTGIRQRPDGAGGVDDVGVAEQHQGVEPLSGQQRPEAVEALPLHPSKVGRVRDAGGRGHRHEAGRHQPSSPR